MTVQPFQWSDLFAFVWQPLQRARSAGVDKVYAMNLELMGPAFTFKHADRIVACGGFVAHGAAAQLWAFLSADCPMVAMTRCANRACLAAGFRDLWATCDVDFDAGARWLRLLGFDEVKVLSQFGLAPVPQRLFVRDTWLRT